MREIIYRQLATLFVVEKFDTYRLTTQALKPLAAASRIKLLFNFLWILTCLYKNLFSTKLFSNIIDPSADKKPSYFSRRGFLEGGGGQN